MNKKREILGACWKVVVEMEKTKDKFERKIRREIKKNEIWKNGKIFLIMDDLVLISKKNMAKCEKNCELQKENGNLQEQECIWTHIA